MAIALGILCGVCFWVITFKQFFKNKDGLIRSIKCAYGIGYSTVLRKTWNSEEQWDEYVGKYCKAGFKLFIWIALGGLIGYLVKYLLNL